MVSSGLCCDPGSEWLLPWVTAGTWVPQVSQSLPPTSALSAPPQPPDACEPGPESSWQGPAAAVPILFTCRRLYLSFMLLGFGPQELPCLGVQGSPLTIS